MERWRERERATSLKIEKCLQHIEAKLAEMLFLFCQNMPRPRTSGDGDDIIQQLKDNVDGPMAERFRKAREDGETWHQAVGLLVRLPYQRRLRLTHANTIEALTIAGSVWLQHVTIMQPLGMIFSRSCLFSRVLFCLIIFDCNIW